MIWGTAPATAGLKLGAAEGFDVGTAVGDLVAGGTAWVANADKIGYRVAPASGVT